MSNSSNLNTCPKCGAAIPAGAPQGLCPKCVMAGAATATESGLAPTATGEIPSLERVAAAFPQLEVLELIGRGGMGFVFKARQPSLDRLVALKLLPDKLAKDASFTERFNREGRVLGRLNHANIVSIYDFGQTGGFYYLLMEYVDGVNLRQAMRAGRFSPAEALAIVPKVCEALQYAHEQGVLHRDIKPENILLDTKGRVKIADFGIAKLVDDSPLEITLTGTGAALGTPHYMAPEQLEKPSTVDHRADIYSLGVVFYEMLTGELPIGRFAAPSSKTPVGANVDEVVFRTLEKEPGDRYQSAGEVQTRVQVLADEASAAEHRGPASPPVGAPMGPLGTVVLGDAAPVKRPAWALLAAGIFNWVGSLVVVCLLAFTGLGQTWPLAPAELGVVCLLILGLSSVIIAGALKMRRLESYPLAIAASVLAMITSPGSIIGLPIGLWSLLTLRQSKVRAAFKGVAARSSETPFSRWSIYGAMLVGLSLPAPMRILVLMLTPGGGVGATDLWIALGSVAMPGLGGTLLGWLGLNEIRDSRGRVRGLPLAMFATLMWPLSIIGGLAVGVPMFLLVPGGAPTATQTIGRFLVLLLPAGVITFAFWAIHATARWAGQQAPPQQRGLLKWVFIAILVIGMGVVMAIKPVKQVRYKIDPPSEGVGPAVSTAAVSPEKQAIQIRLAREQLAEARARFDSGLIPRLEVAKLERDLAVAEARGDSAAIAGAKLKYAELKLETVQQRFKNGTVPRSELSDAEAERDLARIDLAEATKLSGAGSASARMPIRANFRVGKGQVVTFRVVRGERENFAPVPGMAGFAVAPDDERSRFLFVLTPEPVSGSTNQLKWRMSVVNEEGSMNSGASAELGELISMVPTNHFHSIEPDSSFGFYLTGAYSTAETNGISPRTELSLDVRSQPRGRVGVSPDSALIGVGSTNWAQSLKQHQKAAGSRAQPGEVLASQWLKSPVGTNTTNWIRFTFTNVELRSENGQQWLAMGYLTDVHGDCEEVFAVDATGFKPVTRKTGWRTTPVGGSPVEYSGIQWLVPPGIDAATLESFRDSVAEALVAKSFVIPEGEQRSLLRFPIGKAGDLSVGIGAKLRLGINANAQTQRASVWSDMYTDAGRPKIEFGSEKETILTPLFSVGGQLALDRKELVEVPLGAQQWGRPELLLWLADQMVDLAVFDYGDDELWGWGLAMRPSTSRINKPWQSIDHQAVREAFAKPDTGLEYMDRAKDDRMKLYRFHPHTAPLSFAVRTRLGRFAALQIVGITENPRGVKVRYKIERQATPVQP